jgi:hypothetical protein
MNLDTNDINGRSYYHYLPGLGQTDYYDYRFGDIVEEEGEFYSGMVVTSVRCRF